MSVFDFLKGKKTYFLSALSIAAIGAGMATGHVPIVEGVAGIAAAAGLATNRAGSKADADKVIAHVSDAAQVAQAAAQIAAQLNPKLSAISDKVADVAGTVQNMAGQAATAGVEQPV